MLLVGQLIAPRKPLRVKTINADFFRELNKKSLQNAVVYIFIYWIYGHIDRWGLDFRCSKEL